MITRCVLLLTTITACSPATIEQQHAAAMRRHVYVSDMEQYGREDVWTPSLRGDCEDYALWMRERVGGELMYVRTPEGELHVVLNVNGKIVDNLSPTVYPRSEMKHKHIMDIPDTPNGLQSFLRNRGL